MCDITNYTHEARCTVHSSSLAGRLVARTSTGALVLSRLCGHLETHDEVPRAINAARQAGAPEKPSCNKLLRRAVPDLNRIARLLELEDARFAFPEGIALVLASQFRFEPRHTAATGIAFARAPSEATRAELPRPASVLRGGQYQRARDPYPPTPTIRSSTSNTSSRLFVM